MLGPFNVIGCIWPDEVGTILRTNFGLFDCKKYQINGLARVDGDVLMILAVVSINRGRGNMKLFIADCMEHYDEILFCCVWAAEFKDFLIRIGFKHDSAESNDVQPLLKWTKR